MKRAYQSKKESTLLMLSFIKTSGFLFILFSLLVLSVCLNPSSQNPILAQSTVGFIDTELQYTLSIIQTKGSSIRADEKTIYSGTFDLVVQNDKGAETSRRSLNQSFGNKDLLFDGPVNLIPNDYNNDNLLDIPIGLPVDDGSGEYKYHIFSVGKDGKIFSLPIKGYKEEGFIYSAETQAGFSLLDDGETGIGVTLSNFNGDGFGYEYGKYLWNGSKFVFSDKASLEKSDKVTKIYKDKRFDFSVEYPVEWTAIMETFIEPTAEHNASPDSGINIYVDGKQIEKIYVFGQVSHIRPTIDGFHREEFTTNSGLKGHLYSDEIDGKRHIDLILGEGYHGAHIRISPECFNQNKEQIMEVLKSVKI